MSPAAGFGMDVVKTHIERIGGTVELLSQPGQGTTVRVKIPLTLAIIPGLVVWAGGERFVIPQVNLHELIRLEGDEVRTPGAHSFHAGFPAAERAAAGCGPQRAFLSSRRCGPPDEINMVVLQADGPPLWVDRGPDRRQPGNRGKTDGPAAKRAELLRRGHHYGRRPDCADSRRSGNRLSFRRDRAAWAGQAHARPPRGAARRLRRPPAGRCCSAGPAAFERLAIPLAQVARLENIPATSVERAAGRAAVQYRQRILPLLHLAEMLGGSRRSRRDPARLSFTATSASEFGLVVDEISDIIDETIGDPVSLRPPRACSVRPLWGAR